MPRFNNSGVLEQFPNMGIDQRNYGRRKTHRVSDILGYFLIFSSTSDMIFDADRLRAFAS